VLPTPSSSGNSLRGALSLLMTARSWNEGFLVWCWLSEASPPATPPQLLGFHCLVCSWLGFCSEYYKGFPFQSSKISYCSQLKFNVCCKHCSPIRLDGRVCTQRALTWMPVVLLRRVGSVSPTCDSGWGICNCLLMREGVSTSHKKSLSYWNKWTRFL
jgi:hypothetical protein